MLNQEFISQIDCRKYLSMDQVPDKFINIEISMNDPITMSTKDQNLNNSAIIICTAVNKLMELYDDFDFFQPQLFIKPTQLFIKPKDNIIGSKIYMKKKEIKNE